MPWGEKMVSPSLVVTEEIGDRVGAVPDGILCHYPNAFSGHPSLAVRRDYSRASRAQ